MTRNDLLWLGVSILVCVPNFILVILIAKEAFK